MQIPKLGANPSPEDKRDIQFAQVSRVTPKAYPKDFELDLTGVPVLDQMTQPACVGFGGATEKIRQELVETLKLLDMNPRFLYALCKMLDGIPDVEGTYGRILMQVLKKYGVATTTYFPNDVGLSLEEYKDVSKIPQEAFEEARKYRIGAYASVNMSSLNEIKAAIMQGGLLVAQYVDENWWQNKQGGYSFAPEDLLPIRPPTGRENGHFTVYYGWVTNPDGTTTLKFRNSWSWRWCRKGDGEVVFEQYHSYFFEGWKVIDRPNNFDELMEKNMRKITHLVIHHTASPGKTTTLADVNNHHRARNWGTATKPLYASESSLGSFVQYHYFIDWNGVITQTREDWETGWHAQAANPYSLGICLAGNFDKGHDTVPSEAQEAVLTKLMVTLCVKYSVPVQNIVPHRKYADKSCYGTNLSDIWAAALLGKPPKEIPYLPYFQKLPVSSAIAVYDPDTDKMIPFRSGRSFKALFGGYSKVKVDKTRTEWIRPLATDEAIDIIKN